MLSRPWFIALAAVGMVCPASTMAGTTHVTIARFESLTNQQNLITSVVGETVVMVGTVDSINPFLRAVTVDPAHGGAKGSALKVNIPAGPCYPARPVESLYSRHFLPGYSIIVGRGLEVATLPIAIQPSGTPVAGSWGCLTLPANASTAGKPTAVTEIAGVGFPDGRARFFVGTDSGNVFEFSRNTGGSIVLNGQFDLGGTFAISDMGPIPQSGGIMLGVASGNKIAGYRMGVVTPVLLFGRTHPTGALVKSFRTFEPGDRLLAAGSTELNLAFCDGQSDHPFYAELPANLLGFSWLDVSLSPPAFPPPIGGGLLPFTGGLALLVGPAGDVFYRPGFLNGASAVGCVVQVSDGSWQPCTPCPIVLTGDADNSGAITASDVIRLVGYVFKGGTPPSPCRASGDVNCSGVVNAADLIGTINYVFKGGAAPCNVCTMFGGTWSCP